jgi:hypothetical protein
MAFVVSQLMLFLWIGGIWSKNRLMVKETLTARYDVSAK